METFIIAEAGVNHNGNLDRAIEMVKIAADSGANAIKFQSFKTDKIVSVNAPKATYQKKNTGKAGSQFEMLRELELSEKEQVILAEECKKNDIEFMSTPFDIDSAVFLAESLGIKRFKIGSGELTNAPLLLKLAELKRPLILSTGMSNMDEIRHALSILCFGYSKESQQPKSFASFKSFLNSEEIEKILKGCVTILHCTSNYPAQPETINLLAIKTLKKTFNLDVGFSDHSEGIFIALGALALGACVIEKHFTLDRQLPGPDHKASLEPEELIKMIEMIRVLEISIGNGHKIPSTVEKETALVARKSLVAISSIEIGDIFCDKNLGVKRPGIGISPFLYWDYIGKRSNKKYSADDIIEPQ